MTHLTLNSLQAPAVVLPTLKGGNCVVWAFDGVPDDQPWLEQAKCQARVCAPAQDAEFFFAHADEPLGAPLGDYADTSERVARVVGLVVGDSGLEGPDGPVKELQGAAVAHGHVTAYWEQQVEGAALVVAFQAPRCIGWGAAKNVLSQEQLKVRCMRQFEAQGQSLLDHTVDSNFADFVVVRFEGEWDESTLLIRKGLTRSVVLHWAQSKATARQVA